MLTLHQSGPTRSLATESAVYWGQGAHNTALPFVTHLRVFDVMVPDLADEYIFDWTAAAEHMPRLQHITFDFDPEGLYGGGSWLFVWPPFPVTLLLPAACSLENVSLPDLLAPVPNGEHALLEQQGNLHKWVLHKFRHPEDVTSPQVMQPVLHLPVIGQTRHKQGATLLGSQTAAGHALICKLEASILPVAHA